MSGATDVDQEGLSEAEAQQLEEEHFRNVARAFLHYRAHATARVDRAARSFDSFHERQQSRLPGFHAKLARFKEVIAANASFLEAISEHCQIFPENEAPEDMGLESRPVPPEFDMDKVYTTLKQCVRDWAAEGQAERDSCFKPILDELVRLHPEAEARGSVSVAVPGCGLGRLPLEVAKRGFRCQGNEWSVFMLLASNLMLNRRSGTHHTTIYPWAHLFCNVRSSEDQLQAVTIPDTDPFEVPAGADFSMAAGDFLEVYNEPGAWDAVATCFFIDTARNVITYLEHIFWMLKPGGHWVNFGPLLYHFNDNREAASIELTYEEVRQVITSIGFEILEERFPETSPYIQNAASMMQMLYRCAFLSARKPLSTAANGHAAPGADADADTQS